MPVDKRLKTAVGGLEGKEGFMGKGRLAQYTREGKSWTINIISATTCKYDKSTGEREALTRTLTWKLTWTLIDMEH